MINMVNMINMTQMINIINMIAMINIINMINMINIGLVNICLWNVRSIIHDIALVINLGMKDFRKVVLRT